MKVYPENYELIFNVDLNNFKFYGKETISLVAKEKIKEIVLDSIGLKINSCRLIEGEKIKDLSFELDEKKEKLHIKYNFAPGKHRIFIEFEGVLTDKLAGFYRSKYESDGKEKYFATIQFESAYASAAFPCFDHPSFKATFDISFVINKNLAAVSNTLPAEEKILENNKKLVRFERTPKMSTYLLYLGVGEFEFLEDKFENVLIRVVTTHGKSQNGRFAIECAKKFLKYYQEYFDFPYPLSKLDLIAVPDFESGAMENWGAITFRENLILFYPDKSSLPTKQRIAEIIAHELVHQWFGNLVTMKWWDDLWLNESFANFLAYKAVNHYWPEWDIMSQYVLDEVFGGMSLDSLKTSHPIKVEVKITSEIEELFDEISYDKGGSILRMIEGYIGEEIFKKSLRKYISEFQYQNAEAKDLWKCLEEISKKPVLEIMKTFITQIGFPILKLNIKGRKIVLSQERFLLEKGKKKLKGLWDVPLVIQLNKRILKDILKENKKEIYLPEEPEIVNLNFNYSGFYISEYPQETLESLGKNIELFGVINKVGIIHDLFYLVLAGKKDLSVFLDYIKNYFLDEKSPLVGIYIIRILRTIYLLLDSKEVREIASIFCKNVLATTGYEPKENETPLEAALRLSALSCLSLFDDKETLNFALEKFAKYLKEESLHPDLRSFVYSSAVWADDGNYPIVLELYKKNEIQEEEMKLLSALAKTKNKDYINKTLIYSLGKEVRFAQLPYVTSSAADNPFARSIALDWLMKNWKELIEETRRGGILRNVIKTIIPYCGIGREIEVERFFEQNKVPEVEKTLAQAFERMRINSRFVRKYKGKIIR